MRITLRRDADALILHRDDIPWTWRVIAHDGLGTPPVERIRLRGWRQDGETDIGAVLRPRRITFTVLLSPLLGGSNDRVDALRDAIARILRPDREIEIEMRDAWRTRVIRAALVDAISAPSSDDWRHSQRVVIQLEASDPLIYDAQQQTIGWSGIAAGLTIPLAVNITMGDGALNAPTVFHNDGTYPSACVVTVRGPCNSFELTLNSVAISYGSLSADRELRIDSAWGKISVNEHDAATGAFVANRLAGLTGDLTRLRVTPGSNTAQVIVTGGSPQTQIALAYTPAYLSL